MNQLVEPPFAANPPVKVNVNAKILGLVIAILAAISALLHVFGPVGLISLINYNSALNSLNQFCRAYGTDCGTTGIAVFGLIGIIIILAGEVLAAVGGYRMYQLNRQGKEWVIYGLILSVIGSLVTTIGWGGYGIGSFIFGLILNFVIYYLVVVSRFPGEAPLAPPSATPTWGGGGPSSPPPPPA
jgi:hypothetical protein